MSDDLPSFGELPLHMAQNHLFLSVQKEDYAYASKSFLKHAVPSLPPKIVVVVGAGASNNACGLPTGQAAADRLINAFTSRSIVNSQLIQDEIHRITVEYRLERGDFEAVLLALSKFDQTTVLRELNTIYGRRHYPSLTYEVLAHWLKHRFIDAIVNFNFDELLDQAVDDELGSHGYYRVITDGDCPETIEEWLDKNGRFRFPLFIKPHGTASHKSTMRFTRSSYSLLPADLVKLLENLFDDQVDVIVIGHAMQSVEFNDILARKNRGRGLHFYALGRQEPELRVPNAPNATNAPKWDLEFFNTQEGGLDSFIDAITKATDAAFNDGLTLRSIHRHRLISSVFRREAILDEDPGARSRRRENYLRDRVYIEIALAVAKAKGFVSLEHLARGRAGQYFRLLQRHSTSAGTASLLSMCAKLRLREFGYSRDTLYLGNASRDRLRRPILPKGEFAEVAQELAEVTRDNLSGERQRKCDRETLAQAFMSMYEGDEIEISSDTGATTNDIFANPIPMVTLASLRAHTRRMMLSSDWDSILCTAESGQWLLRDEWRNEIKKRKAGLAIIVADETYCDRLREGFGPELENRVRWLPWWLHNKHVTVFLKEKKAVEAMYFERRLRTSHITPLRLDIRDAQIAMDVFVAYWIKATQYQQFGDAIEIQPEQVRSESKQVIDALYKNR